jgi:hypothetical protein
MGIGDMICEYIYGSFLLIKAALEVAQKTSKALLKALDTLFNTLVSLCRFVIDIGIKTVLDAIRVFQKWLVDQLLNFDFSALCDGMFKCTALLEEVLDPNSLLSRTLKKYTNYNSAPQEELYAVVGDFRKFKDTICNFGFTYNFGLSGIKSLLNAYEAMCGEFLDMLERNKERIRRFLQKYLDLLINIGTFDMLDKLKKFFDCVLIDTDICSNIKTANSFYNDMLSKMCIEEAGDGYRLDSGKSAYFMNAFDSRINQLNNSKQELQKLIDSMLAPSQVKAANNAFNLAANIFPGGASWKDIKEGNFWKKNKCYQYFKLKRRAFIKAFKAEQPSLASMATDAILGGLNIDDTSKAVTISFADGNGNIINYKYDENNMLDGMSIETDNEAEYIMNNDGQKYEMNGALYNEETDEIISNLRAAIEISVHDNEKLKSQVQRKIGMEGYTSEHEVLKTF